MSKSHFLAVPALLSCVHRVCLFSSSPYAPWKPRPQPRSPSWPSSRSRPSSTKSRTFLRSTRSSTTPSYPTSSSGTRRSRWDICSRSWWVWAHSKVWGFPPRFHWQRASKWLLIGELSDSHCLYLWITRLNSTARPSDWWAWVGSCPRVSTPMALAVMLQPPIYHVALFSLDSVASRGTLRTLCTNIIVMCESIEWTMLQASASRAVPLRFITLSDLQRIMWFEQGFWAHSKL